MTVKLGVANIETNNKAIWNIIKNLFIPIWYSNKTIEIQLIPTMAIITLLIL